MRRHRRIRRTVPPWFPWFWRGLPHLVRTPNLHSQGLSHQPALDMCRLPGVEKERQLAEAMKDVKTLKSGQAAWAKEKKALEAQVCERMLQTACALQKPISPGPSLQVERMQKRAADAEAALNNRDQAAKEANKESSRWVCVRCSGASQYKRSGYKLGMMQG